MVRFRTKTKWRSWFSNTKRHFLISAEVLTSTPEVGSIEAAPPWDVPYGFEDALPNAKVAIV